MILRSVLQNFTWTPYGIECGDPNVAKKVHKFLREAVLDRHICVSKIIGFTVQSEKGSKEETGDYITRHPELGESYPELVNCLGDKVFVGVNADYLNVLLQPGVNTVLTSPFGDLRDYKATVLYEDPYICRSLRKPVVLNVKLQYDCGYKEMPENCKNLQDDYFPCTSNFSVAEFFRILPMTPGTTLVPIRYYNGGNDVLFKKILSDWLNYLESGNGKDEERIWLQHFAL